MVFTVSEKKVKQADGASYSLGNYREGADYVARRAFKGVRYMFRKGILAERGIPEGIEVSVVDPSLVEHKQVSRAIEVTAPVDPAVATAEESSVVVATVKDYLIVEAALAAKEALVKQEPQVTQDPVIVRPSQLDDCIRTARVIKKMPNQRYVDTDLLGRVYVGAKGNLIKLQQLISVKNGNLVVG